MRRERAVRTFSVIIALSGIVACSVSAEIGGSGDAEGDGPNAGPGSSAATNAAAVGETCKVGKDCESGSCKAGKCAAPAPDDGVKNGDESDIDCGGAKAPKCAAGKTCEASSDCASDACSYAKKCVASPSCTGHHGGDTCGAGETGETSAKHESCCTTVAVPDGPSGAFVIDKYPVTAGRMRAFVEKTNGNMQAFIGQAKPKGWNDAWTEELPTNMKEALYLLGPGLKRGCNVLNQGGRTYDQPPIDGEAGEKSDFSQDVLDEKALNCVPWYVSAALCAFDGKRLPKAEEIRHVFKNGGGDKYPWSGTDPRSGVINHYYAYQTPKPPASMRIVGSGDGAYPLDHAFYVSPPGRFPDGASKNGVQDIAGNVLPWVQDGARRFIWTHSWEKHKGDLSLGTWDHDDAPNGYYAIGARCASD